MRRRRLVAEQPVPPRHLAEFDPVEWGYFGPHVDERGYTAPGYHEAQTRHGKAYYDWCEEHPDFDWLAALCDRHEARRGVT